MSPLLSLSLVVVLLSLPGSLGFIFGNRDNSRSSEIHFPFLNIGGRSSKESSSRESSSQESSSQESSSREKPPVPDDLNPQFFCQGPCKDGWISYLGYCHIYVAREFSWKDAEGYCLSLFSRAHLTSVLSDNHNEFLMTLARSKGYRGDTLWTGGNKEKGSKTWADGSPLNFLKFPNGNLFGIFGGNKCISLNLLGSKFWSELACTQKLHFICIYKPSNP